MLRASAVLGGLLVLVMLPGFEHPDAPDLRCTIGVDWGPRVYPTSLYILGEGTTDSIAAPISDDVLNPPSSPSGLPVHEEYEPSAAHGQLFTVRGVTPRAGDVPGSEILGHDEVVLVWWGYDSACRTMNWSLSVIYSEPGEENVVSGRLRAREHWADGIPTIDVFRPNHRLEPQRSRAIPNGGSGFLDARELFGYLERMPVVEPSGERIHSIDDLDEATRASLLTWLAEDPERARMRPVARSLRFIPDS